MRRLTRLFVFRHGETDWNAEERFQGHLDIPLNDRGREQARALGQKLLESGIEALLTSDLARSIETARIVAGQIGLPSERIFRGVGIKEAHLGEAQGLTTEEIRERFGEGLLRRWRSNLAEDADVSYPGGETGAQVLKRATEAIAGFAHANQHFSRIGISTHGGVIRRLMHRIMMSRVAIPNGVVYEVLFDPDSWPGSWPFSGVTAPD